MRLQKLVQVTKINPCLKTNFLVINGNVVVMQPLHYVETEEVEPTKKKTPRRVPGTSSAPIFYYFDLEINL